MSSANKRKNGSLEDAFRHRMQDAEATPAPDLWDRIAHDLTVQENVQYKKRAAFYRQLAAACFVLLVMAGAVLVYQFNTSGTTADHALQEAQNGAGKSIVPGTTQAGELATESNSTLPEATAIKEEPAIAASPAATGSTGYRTPVAQNNKPAIAKNRKAFLSEPASSIAGAGKSGIEKPLENSLTDRSATEQLAAAGTSTDQHTQASNPVKPSAFIQSPSVLSLMAKDQQKSVVFSAQDKPDAKQQARDLAQELNLGAKPDTDSGKEAADSRWSMSMAYMPAYFAQNIGLSEQMMRTTDKFSLASDRPAISTETAANMEKARDEYENNTDPAFSYAVAVKAGFKLGKKLKLLAGLGFSQNTARTNTSYVVEQYWTNPKTNAKVERTPSTIFLPSLNNSFTTDSISVSAIDPFDVDYRYRMVSVPIGVQYEHEIMNGWNLYMTGGVAANILVQSSISSSRADIVSVSYEQNGESPFRNTHFSGNVGLGVSKQVSDAISVSLGPEFKSFFNTMLAEPDKAVATQGKPYTIGLNMSLNYQLGTSKK